MNLGVSGLLYPEKSFEPRVIPNKNLSKFSLNSARIKKICSQLRMLLAGPFNLSYRNHTIKQNSRFSPHPTVYEVLDDS